MHVQRVQIEWINNWICAEKANSRTESVHNKKRSSERLPTTFNQITLCYVYKLLIYSDSFEKRCGRLFYLAVRCFLCAVIVINAEEYIRFCIYSSRSLIIIDIIISTFFAMQFFETTDGNSHAKWWKTRGSFEHFIQKWWKNLDFDVRRQFLFVNDTHTHKTMASFSSSSFLVCCCKMTKKKNVYWIFMFETVQWK